MFERTSNLILLIVLTTFLFIGGLGFTSNYLLIAGILLPFVFHFILSPNKKIVLPKNFFLYVATLVISSLGLLWSRDVSSSVSFILLLISGASFWIFAYNNKEKLTPYLERIIIILGLIFGILFLYYSFTGLWPPAWGVFSFTSQYRNHNHIGDFWSMALLIPVFALIKGKRRFFDFFLMAVGLFFLAASLSRSAYLSFFAGLIFLFWKSGNMGRYKKLFLASVLVLITLFIFTSLFKPTFETRIYFIQSIMGLGRFPFGVGLGNFSVVSGLLQRPIFGLVSYSAYVHNIALEMVSGLGILGIIFIYWLIRISKEVLACPKQNLLYGAIFVCFLVNFLFDRTYLTPTLIWIWFMSLGLSQENNA